MCSTKRKTTISALSLVLIAPLCVAELAAQYPPPPGLYRPLSETNAQSYRPDAGADRPSHRDRVPTPDRFSPPPGDRTRTSRAQQNTPPRQPDRTGAPARLEDRYRLDDSPRLVPGYAPPGEDDGESRVDTSPIGQTPISRYLNSNPTRYPAEAAPGDRPGGGLPMRPASRFSPPELDSPPPAPPAAIGQSGFDAPRSYRRATPPGGPMYADPYRGRFRPPSAEELGGKGAPAGAFVPNGDAAGVSAAPRLPRSAPPLDPRFSDYQGAYDSRFRPPGLAPRPGERRP